MFILIRKENIHHVQVEDISSQFAWRNIYFFIPSFLDLSLSYHFRLNGVPLLPSLELFLSGGSIIFLWIISFGRRHQRVFELEKRFIVLIEFLIHWKVAIYDAREKIVIYFSDEWEGRGGIVFGFQMTRWPPVLISTKWETKNVRPFFSLVLLSISFRSLSSSRSSLLKTYFTCD